MDTKPRGEGDGISAEAIRRGCVAVIASRTRISEGPEAARLCEPTTLPRVERVATASARAPRRGATGIGEPSRVRGRHR